MTDNEITEAYFVARGWWKKTEGYNLGWYGVDDYHGTPLPNILESYPAFKQHVLEVMGEEGFSYDIISNTTKLVKFFMWYGQFEGHPVLRDYIAEIKDNNILHAAVIAATRYFNENKS